MTSFLLLAKIISFLTGLFFVGFSICRPLFKVKNWFFAVPMSLAVGGVTYIFFLNLTSLIIPLEINFFISFIVLLFFSSLLVFLKRKDLSMEPVGLRAVRKWKAAVFGGLLIIFVANAAIIAFSNSIDDPWHYQLVARLAKGSFPLRQSFAPQFTTSYHYASNLLIASFVNLFHVFPPQAFAIMMAALSFVCLGLVLIFFYHYAKNSVFPAFAAAFLFYYLGGLKYLIILYILIFKTPFFPYQLLSQALNKKNLLWFFWNENFAPFFVAPRIKPMLLTFICFFLILFLRRLAINKYTRMLFNVIFFSVLALSYETLFLPLFLAFALIESVSIIKSKRYKELFFLMGTLILIGLTALVQGGQISFIFWNFFKASEFAVSPPFILRLLPSIPVFTCEPPNYCAPFPLNGILAWKVLFTGFPLIIFFPFLAYFLTKIKDKTLNIVFLTAIISILIPVFIGYPKDEANWSRFLIQGSTLAALLLSVAIIFFKARNPGGFFKFSIGVVAALLAAQGAGLNFYYIVSVFTHPETLRQYLKMDSSPSSPVKDEIYFNNMDVEIFKHFVGDGSLKNKLIYDILPQRAGTIFGGFSPDTIPEWTAIYYKNEEVEKHNKAMDSLFKNITLDNLKRLNIDYVYLTPELQDRTDPDEREFFKSGRLVLVYGVGNGGNFRALYKIIY